MDQEQQNNTQNPPNAIIDEVKSDKMYLEQTAKKIDQLLENYDNVMDMTINIHAYLGSSHIPLIKFLKLTKGSIINLEKAAGEGANFSINDRMVGKGEIMVYEKNLAIRINEILSQDAIIYHFYTESH